MLQICDFLFIYLFIILFYEWPIIISIEQMYNQFVSLLTIQHQIHDPLAHKPIDPIENFDFHWVVWS